MAAPIPRRFLRALFGLVLGTLQLVSYHFQEFMFQLLNVFPQAWIFSFRPVVWLGQWYGFWGPRPAWAPWLYAVAFVGVGVAGFLTLSKPVRLFANFFFGTNLVLYWLAYLTGSAGQLGNLVGGDIGYTLLMIVGLVLFNSEGAAD